jgi:ferrous iron transport protein B
LERAPHTIADSIVRSIYWEAEKIAQASTSCAVEARINWDRKIDDILTSRLWGFPVMLLMLTGVLWLTISGANVPSELLATGLFWLHDRLLDLFIALNAPHWLTGFFVLGVFRSVAWVVSVMLPPMAIFFPLFTLLEDAGYLPRVAFNLDACFKKAFQIIQGRLKGNYSSVYPDLLENVVVHNPIIPRPARPSAS